MPSAGTLLTKFRMYTPQNSLGRFATLCTHLMGILYLLSSYCVPLYVTDAEWTPTNEEMETMAMHRAAVVARRPSTKRAMVGGCRQKRCGDEGGGVARDGEAKNGSREETERQRDWMSSPWECVGNMHGSKRCGRECEKTKKKSEGGGGGVRGGRGGNHGSKVGRITLS